MHIYFNYCYKIIMVTEMMTKVLVNVKIKENGRDSISMHNKMFIFKRYYFRDIIAMKKQKRVIVKMKNFSV